MQNELRRVKTTVVPEIKRIEEKIESLQNDRATLLTELRNERSRIDQSRSAFVEELNLRLAGVVMVDLSDRDTSLLFEAINNPLRRSGMQHREDQVLLACKSFTPREVC